MPAVPAVMGLFSMTGTETNLSNQWFHAVFGLYLAEGIPEGGAAGSADGCTLFVHGESSGLTAELVNSITLEGLRTGLLTPTSPANGALVDSPQAEVGATLTMTIEHASFADAVVATSVVPRQPTCTQPLVTDVGVPWPIVWHPGDGTEVIVRLMVLSGGDTFADIQCVWDDDGQHDVPDSITTLLPFEPTEVSATCNVEHNTHTMTPEGVDVLATFTYSASDEVVP